MSRNTRKPSGRPVSARKPDAPVVASVRAVAVVDQVDDADQVVREQRDQLSAIEACRERRLVVARAQDRLREAAVHANSVGVSWDRIGRATGLTGEGARKRWA